MKGKALRRALATSEVARIAVDIPLIQDRTEFITPELAQGLLRHNRVNRPVNWRKVEEYADLMARGKWELHAQGIILDEKGNLLTGQKRLWAIIFSGVAGIHMRISTGTPAKSANLIDRGTPQTSRDLASRRTERKHSPLEASIARAILAMAGILRPSADELSDAIVENSGRITKLLVEVTGTKKTKAVLMVIAAICASGKTMEEMMRLIIRIDWASVMLEKKLCPMLADKCWGRGAAFGLAMEHAKNCILEL